MSDFKPRIVTLDPGLQEKLYEERLEHLIDPNGTEFAVTKEERAGHPINTSQWRTVGAWRYREFGNEAQLRNNALPWLALDLYRSEVEELYRSLADILSRPALLPYRVSRWERVRQWWLRKVWRRRHYAELAAAREALVEEYTRKGPWST